jgi:hypothetical protein
MAGCAVLVVLSVLDRRSDVLRGSTGGATA